MKSSGKTFVQVIVIKDHVYCYRYLCAFFIAAVFDASQSYRNRNRELQLRHKDRSSKISLSVAYTSVGIRHLKCLSRSWDPVTLSKAMLGFCGRAEATPHFSHLVTHSSSSPTTKQKSQGTCASALCAPRGSPALINYKVSVGSTERYSATQNYLQVLLFAPLVYFSTCLSSCISTNLLFVSWIDSDVYTE